MSSSIQHSPCAESTSHIYTTQYDVNSLLNINSSAVAGTVDKNVVFPSLIQSPRHNIKALNIIGTRDDVGNDGCENDSNCGGTTMSTISSSSISNLDTTIVTTNSICKRRSSSTTITNTTSKTVAATIVDYNNEQKQNDAENNSQPTQHQQQQQQQQKSEQPTNGNGGSSSSNSNANANVNVGVTSPLLPSSASTEPADSMVKNITKEEKVSQLLLQQQQEKATNVVNAKNISIVSESAGITLNRYARLFYICDHIK